MVIKAFLGNFIYKYTANELSLVGFDLTISGLSIKPVVETAGC